MTVYPYITISDLSIHTSLSIHSSQSIHVTVYPSISIKDTTYPCSSFLL